jgi:hypothetical protein
MRESLTHLREDGFKGSKQRQIRLVKSATFRIRPRTGQPNLLMNGYLRIVDVPGLGRRHEAARSYHPGRNEAGRRHDRPGHRCRPPARR